MKKKMIATGFIVAPGVAWSGSSWYTGRQPEISVQEMLTEANAETERSAYTAGLELVQQNYRRGVFTTRFDLVVKPVDGVAQIWLKPGQSIVIKESIDHGPFPLAALKSFYLMPVTGHTGRTGEKTLGQTGDTGHDGNRVHDAVSNPQRV